MLSQRDSRIVDSVSVTQVQNVVENSRKRKRNLKRKGNQKIPHGARIELYLDTISVSRIAKTAFYSKTIILE